MSDGHRSQSRPDEKTELRCNRQNVGQSASNHETTSPLALPRPAPLKATHLIHNKNGPSPASLDTGSASAELRTESVLVAVGVDPRQTACDRLRPLQQYDHHHR